MRLIRLRLFALVLVVVTGQLASTVATGAVLSWTSTELTAPDETACTCAHGSMAACPMHGLHNKTGSPMSGSPSHENRWCTGYGDHSEIVLTTLVLAGPVVDRHRTVVPASAPEVLATTSTHPLVVVLPIVPPPPRA